jgi:hypothetical protein
MSKDVGNSLWECGLNTPLALALALALALTLALAPALA